MGYELGYRCLVETRKLLLLMGVCFVVILFLQYLQLPYGSLMASLFPAGESQLPEPFKSSYSSPNTSGNYTYPVRLNSSNVNRVKGLSTPDEVPGGNSSRNTNFEDGFNPEIGEIFDDDTLNDDIDSEEELPTHDFLEMNSNSTNQEEVSNNNSPPGNDTNSSILTNDTSPSPSPVGSSTGNIFLKDKNPGLPELHDEISPSASNSSTSDPPTVKQKPTGRVPRVVPISEMNDMLIKSRVSYSSMKPKWSSQADQELLNAKLLIDNAPIIRKDPNIDISLYRNYSAFKRSYELMEQTLKVYIYSEGESPIFHRPPLKGIYASEGWFMKQMKASKTFTTKNTHKAHLFYFPFSSRMLEMTLYKPDSHNRENLVEYLSNYLKMVKAKYPFWNRTDGADHFVVACHDWAPYETRHTMATCIRSLCNADIREGFQFGKDASLPEIIIRKPQNPLRQLGGKPALRRPILAFFAGNMHGYLRPILLDHWGNRDPDMKIFGQLSKRKGEMSYAQYMKSSRYCICARGYEVNSPRVVEAIVYECVPVIISDNFVPPFFETLNWESFAVFVLEKDMPNLKKILQSISKKRYLKMQQMVKQVQHHFLWHNKPEKYDVFHMILHSVWHNRLLQVKSS